MDVGLVALAVGALLAAGIGASLLAGRLRLPGLVLVLVLGMVIGSDGLEWINFGANDADYDVAQNAAIMALALILYEGGLSSGWAEIKPVIGVSVAAGDGRHRADRRAHRGRRGAAVQRAEHARGADPRLDRGRHRRRRRLRRPARIDAAAQDRAHARGRVRRQRPDRRAARAGVASRRSTTRTSGSLDALWLGVSELAIGAAVGLAVGGFGVWVLQRVTLPSAGLYPVASVAFAGHGLRRRGHAARHRLSRRLPRRPGDRQRHLARPAHDHHLPRGPRVGRAARRSSCCSGCS